MLRINEPKSIITKDNFEMLSLGHEKYSSLMKVSVAGKVLKEMVLESAG